ncbi:MAG: LysM peptidoglycan-binding domain-containing protein [Anaerolineae bacterium]
MSEQTRSSAGQAPGTSGIGQLLGSLAVTLVSVGMLLGSFLLSQLDASGVRPPPTKAITAFLPSPTPFLPTITPTPPPSATETAVPPTPTLSPSPTSEKHLGGTPSDFISPTPTSPSSLLPSCPRPPGWIVYIVQRGDTLTSLAWRAGTTTYALMQANCLGTTTIYPGQQVYLPPTLYASPTPQPYPCGPPLDWIMYTVQPGDTLYSLSRRFGVGIEAIRRGNCLPNYTIYAGYPLYLPPLPPTPIPSPTLSPTPTPTATELPILTPTSTPTGFPTLTPTFTPTLLPTFTATPILTGTATHTPTYTPTPTGLPVSTPTPSATPTPTESPTPMYTPAPSATPTPTEPPTSTYTPALSATPTPTEPLTFTYTPTPSS